MKTQEKQDKVNADHDKKGPRAREKNDENDRKKRNLQPLRAQKDPYLTLTPPTSKKTKKLLIGATPAHSKGRRRPTGRDKSAKLHKA